MDQTRMSIVAERFALRSVFTIARGSRTHAEVLTVELQRGGRRGRGECVPYARYRETLDSVAQQIESVREPVEAGLRRNQLVDSLPPGAARNAIDAALWDLELRESAARDEPPPLPPPRPVRTARTLSLAPPQTMAGEALEVAANFSTLKLKLGGEPGSLDLERVCAVRGAAPDHQLIVDANEAWPAAEVERRIEELNRHQVALIEQPLRAGEDEVLADFEHGIPLCADESFHTIADLDVVAERYEVVNLKLDKTGGLTHALEAVRAAAQRRLGVMVGCMVGTSLAMAPALYLAQYADWVDLDAPYLLGEDRDPPVALSDDGWIGPYSACWGA